MEATEDSIAHDVLRGASAISKFIGENERRTNYLLERGLLPAGKQGQSWVASKRRLREHYDALARGAKSSPEVAA